MGEIDRTSLDRVQDFNPLQEVVCYDADGAEMRGKIDRIEIRMTTTDNPYTVHFKRGRKWHTRKIEPAD